MVWLRFHRNPLPWADELRWIQNQCKGRSQGARKLRIAFACEVYMVWAERNTRIFKLKVRSVQGLV